MARLGRVERRFSYASWTSPSHYNLLIGLMPHVSPKHVYASDYYREDIFKFNARLGIQQVEFKHFVPKLYLPSFLKERLGYRTSAMVSLPVLNPKTILNTGFDSYVLMDSHNDMRSMVRQLNFHDETPVFYLLNVGETHYPYSLPSEPPEQWPRISGMHGVFEHLDGNVVGGKLVSRGLGMFEKIEMKTLRNRQIEAVKYLDTVVEELFDVVPKNTYITITSDHGELFGEDGYFGHGPIYHRKVFEVPFLEGKLR